MSFAFNQRVTDAPIYPTAQLDEKKKKLIEAGIKVFDFGTGDPKEPTPEFIRKACANGIPVVSQYPSVKGTPEFRKAVAGYLDRRFKVKVDSNTQILPITGSKEAIYNISFLMVGEGNPKNVIICPEPGYPVMERSAVISGAEYYPVKLVAENNYLLDLNRIPEAILKRAAMVWVNYPNNPTGVECSLDYYRQQIAIAKRFGILYCSDECYVDMFFGSPSPSALEVTTEGVLAFHSCSKRSGMTAYRSGFIAGDAEVLKQFAQFRNSVGVATPIYTMTAATAAWSDDAHADERREVFRAKRDLFTDFFKRQGLSTVPMTATFYFWVQVPRGMTGESYAAKLLEHGIVVGPGTFYGDHCTEHFRLALVPTLEDCKKAIAIWEKIEWNN